MAKVTVSKMADELVEKVIKQWEQKKLEYETAKFKKKYISQNEFFTEDPQLKLFGE